VLSLEMHHIIKKVYEDYQDVEENGSGSGIVQGEKEGESEGDDDSYHSEVLKSPISTDCDSDGTKKAISP